MGCGGVKAWTKEDVSQHTRRVHIMQIGVIFAERKTLFIFFTM
jgi:hypothetical protein